MPRDPARRRKLAAAIVVAAAASLTLLLSIMVVCGATTLAVQAGRRVTVSGVGRGRGFRRCWARDRHLCWWDGEAQDLSDAEFRTFFRMTWDPFYHLADLLRPDVERQTTKFRDAIDYEKVVAMALYRLGTGEKIQLDVALPANPLSPPKHCGTGASYHSIAKDFGTHKSVVCAATKRVVAALVARAPDFISLPRTEDDIAAAALESQRLYRGGTGIPTIVGMVDGSHIKVNFSDRRAGYMDYRSRKGWSALTLMAMCNASSKFTAINAGWAGSVGDARVFRNTSFGGSVLNGSIFHGTTFFLPNGQELPYCVAGDAAFPGCPCLLKPFVEVGALTDPQQWFNHVQSIQRQAIERAFGRLKGRWRTLLHCADYAIAFVPHVITACCVLHNFCEDHAAEFNDELFVEEDDDDPAWVPSEVQEDIEAVTGMVHARQRIVDFLWLHAPAEVKASGVAAWRRATGRVLR
jgi:hypothetical protein